MPHRKNTLDDDEKGVADKLSADDKEEIENTINEALDWLDENPEADKDEYTSKQKEVEAIANPIMRNVYQGAGAGGGGGEEDEDYDFGDDELRARCFPSFPLLHSPLLNQSMRIHGTASPGAVP